MGIPDDFVARYTREFDYYANAALICERECQLALERSGIRAIVTSRAKRPDRLLEKLRKRDEKTPYKSVDDCYADIIDLAGVRIALYFPSEREDVERFITTQFDVQRTKSFPEKPFAEPTDTDSRPLQISGRYERKFPGYGAMHYRVRLRPERLSENEKRFSQSIIEIQVASVLMHAWAEVNHDLAYKSFSGELSYEEHSVLDQLNGLVINGEGHLELLRRRIRERLERNKLEFRSHYELAAYLHQQFNAVCGTPKQTQSMGRIDILYRFLQLIHQNHPAGIDRALSTIPEGAGERTIAENIADAIVSDDREYARQYKEAQEELIDRNPYSVEIESKKTSQAHALGLIMERWTQLEALIRRLAVKHGLYPDESAVPSNTSEIVKKLYEADKLPRELLPRITYAKEIRNTALHHAPGGYDLSNESRVFDDTLQALRAYAEKE